MWNMVCASFTYIYLTKALLSKQQKRKWYHRHAHKCITFVQKNDALDFWNWLDTHPNLSKFVYRVWKTNICFGIGFGGNKKKQFGHTRDSIPEWKFWTRSMPTKYNYIASYLSSIRCCISLCSVYLESFPDIWIQGALHVKS